MISGLTENKTLLIKIVLNGEQISVPDGLTVTTLLRHLGVDSSRVAVEVDRKIVRKTSWDEARVEEDAEVEIVHFVGGGSF